MKSEICGTDSVQNGWAVLCPPSQMGYDKTVECVCMCGNRRVFYWLYWTNERLPVCSCQKDAPRNVRHHDKELESAQEDLHIEWRLVSHGSLPPADCFTKEGRPVWNLFGIARILGVSRSDLVAAVRNMKNSQPRGLATPLCC
jgi:hypothetical protein